MSRIINDARRAWRNANGGRLKLTFGLFIIVFIWVVVPTGTPDDLITTGWLYVYLGHDAYMQLLAVALGVALAYEKRWI